MQTHTQETAAGPESMTGAHPTPETAVHCLCTTSGAGRAASPQGPARKNRVTAQAQAPKPHTGCWSEAGLLTYDKQGLVTPAVLLDGYQTPAPSQQ